MLKPLALFIFILCTIQPNKAYDLIEETCKRTSNHNQCIQYLKSDPKSPSASLNELAVIMFNIMKGKALNTITKIDKLLAGGKIPRGSRAYDSLELCDNLYKEISTSNAKRGALGSVIGGDPEDAIRAADDVVGKAIKCENNFDGRGFEKTPVTDDNNEIKVVATIAGDIVKLFR